ncbi:hypothetical protein pb186bvf_001392 [Paramecium bursaria]
MKSYNQTETKTAISIDYGILIFNMKQNYYRKTILKKILKNKFDGSHLNSFFIQYKPSIVAARCGMDFCVVEEEQDK